MKTRIHGSKLLLSAGIAVTLAISMLTGGGTANAASPTSVNLRTAASFAVLAGTEVTNTGATTAITGDLGVHPGTSVTGFPPGIITGTIHAADAIALQAKADLGLAYDDAAGRIPVIVVAGGTLGGTLVPGVYNAGGATLRIPGTLTLDAQNDPSAVWIFQATSDLVAASSSSVRLINGASSCNVFWQVSTSATLNSGSTFMGTILASTSITMGDGVTVHGRALARTGNVTLIGDSITTVCSISSVPTAGPSADSLASSSASAPASSSASSSTSASASSSASSSTSASASSSASASAAPTTAAPTTAAPTGTPPPTSTLSADSSNNSTLPLFALLICLAFGGLGLAAVEAQRRNINR